jgi:hypothetical protein
MLTEGPVIKKQPRGLALVSYKVRALTDELTADHLALGP